MELNEIRCEAQQQRWKAERWKLTMSSLVLFFLSLSLPLVHFLCGLRLVHTLLYHCLFVCLCFCLANVFVLYGLSIRFDYDSIRSRWVCFVCKVLENIIVWKPKKKPWTLGQCNIRFQRYSAIIFIDRCSSIYLSFAAISNHIQMTVYTMYIYIVVILMVKITNFLSQYDRFNAHTLSDSRFYYRLTR